MRYSSSAPPDTAASRRVRTEHGAHTVRGLFDSPGDVARAIDLLQAHSVPARSVHVDTVDYALRPTRRIAVRYGSSTRRGAILGVILGSLFGLLTFLLAEVAVGRSTVGRVAPDPLLALMLLIGSGAAMGVGIGAAIGIGAGLRRMASLPGLTQDRFVVVVETGETSALVRQALAEAGARTVTG